MTKVTGWDTGLSQDYNKGLGQWFANRLGARQQLRQDFEMKQITIEKAVLEQLVGALEMPCDRWSSKQYKIVMNAIKACRAAIDNAEQQAQKGED